MAPISAFVQSFRTTEAVLMSLLLTPVMPLTRSMGEERRGGDGEAPEFRELER